MRAYGLDTAYIQLLSSFQHEHLNRALLLIFTQPNPELFQKKTR